MSPIREKFLPALIEDDAHITDIERALYALPARHGGLGIDNPVLDAPYKFDASVKITHDLKTLIKSSSRDYTVDPDKQKKLKLEIKKSKEARLKGEKYALRASSSDEMKRAIDLASEKGASCIFTALPLAEQDFVFRSKRDFRDLIRIRYRKRIPNLPTVCPCGASYSLNHSQICKLSGFIHLRHDEEKRLFAYQGKNVFRHIDVEPLFLPLNGE